MAYDADLEGAHRHCASHRTEILTSPACGCFYCLAVFSPTEILTGLTRTWMESGGPLCAHGAE